MTRKQDFRGGVQRLLRLLLSTVVGLAPLVAVAGVGKVSSPEVTKGMAEIEYSGTRSHDTRRDQNNRQSHTYEIEYGLSDRLLLGLEVKSAREAGVGSSLSGVGAEAQYVLTRQGDTWLTSAIKGEYLIGTNNGEPDEAELSLLTSYRYGNVQVVANIGLERAFFDASDPNVNILSALQASYTLSPHLNPGLEWQADHGSLRSLSRREDSEYYVGPIVKGTLFSVGNSALGYTAGYYWALNEAAAARAARIQLGYEFAF